MKRRQSIYILLVFILLLMPSVGTLIAGPETTVRENLEEKGAGRPEDFGSWFETHYAGRSAMITMNAMLKRTFAGSSYGDEIIIGKDGYLFYGETLDDYFRRSPMTERELFVAAYNLSLMQEYCRLHGAEFLFVLCPNKNTLYPQYMPDQYLQGEGRTNASRLMAYLEKMEVAYVDMYPVLAGKEEAYFRSDTHWTQAGAFFGYEAIMQAFGRPLPSSEEGVWNTQKHNGDLEQMLMPGASSLEEAPVRHVPWTYSADEEASALNVHTENPQGTGALVMFRDSFGTDLLPYLAQTYSRCWFTQVWPCIMDDVEIMAAGDVILEKVERNLRDLTQRPLIMDSPEVTPALYTDCLSETQVTLSPEAALVRIWADVESSLIREETTMYIGVNGRVYQAVLSSGTGEEGAGCYIYLPGDSLPDAVRLEVYLEDDGSWQRIFHGSTMLAGNRTQ